MEIREHNDYIHSKDRGGVKAARSSIGTYPKKVEGKASMFGHRVGRMSLEKYISPRDEALGAGKDITCSSAVPPRDHSAPAAAPVERVPDHFVRSTKKITGQTVDELYAWMDAHDKQMWEDTRVRLLNWSPPPLSEEKVKRIFDDVKNELICSENTAKDIFNGVNSKPLLSSDTVKDLFAGCKSAVVGTDPRTDFTYDFLNKITAPALVPGS